MPESKLKTAALNIAEKLQSAQHQTLLHGDAKLANFCFSADRQQVNALDFQYVGRGVGVVDVVYLLGSCFTGSELAQHADDILDEYYVNLTKFAVHHEVIEEWRDLVPYAWADFERFLVGWSPGHKKLNAYSQAQTKKALKKL
jgi:Ser/Thr protein kinase RdoA (MazF antagonist)